MNVSGDFSWKHGLTKRMNSPLLPNNIRGLIIGKSNCGKTTLLFNLLLQPNWLDYDHLYAFGNTLHQQEYQIMKKAFDLGLSKHQIVNIFKNQKELEKIKASPLEIIEQYTGYRKNEIKADFFSDCNMIPDPTTLNIHEKNLLILDDCFLGPQNKAEAYYTRGRLNNCDIFYISQSYFRLPRHTIRENMNFLVLFPQDVKNLSHIYADHCDGDMTLDEFKRFCQKVWHSDHHFVVIDLTSDVRKGKYRKNLDTFYLPSDMSFIHIKDPLKRDKILADHLATMIPKESGIKTIQRPIPDMIFEKSGEDNEIEKNKHAKLALKKINIPTAKIDKYFGIFQRSDGKYQMGRLEVTVGKDEIIVAGIRYSKSDGLWDLIMSKIPTNFTAEDLNLYRQLVQQTDVMNHPNDLNNNSRPKSTYKWRKIFSKFRSGEGIQFLPGDIKGLQNKLHYLLAEFRAGNISATQNQIVAITDELLRRKRLSRAEYNNINNFVQKGL